MMSFKTDETVEHRLSSHQIIVQDLIGFPGSYKKHNHTVMEQIAPPVTRTPLSRLSGLSSHALGLSVDGSPSGARTVNPGLACRI